jgi:two-component system, chemotaxis family, protein-glutamate methylesterase/glutaminase
VRPVRLAIVDDALFIREGLRRLLAAEPRIEVVGTAATGAELLRHLETWRPEVITLDLEMPELDGLETLEHLMAHRPLPVVILSTHSGAGAPQTIEALSRGAVDFIDKEAYSLVDFEALRGVLVQKILTVTRRDRWTFGTPTEAPAAPAPAAANRFDLVVIGASTGGPRAVEGVLAALGSEVTVPVVVVQHMPAGFTEAFAARLNRCLPLTVREGETGMLLAPGEVIVAPGGRHLVLRPEASELRVAVVDQVADSLHVPSVDALFLSAQSALGGRVAAILLTGMGRDGARGMRALWDAGAHTIAQDEQSSVVYGMPRAAVELGGASEVLGLERIGARLKELLEEGTRVPGAALLRQY